MSSIIKGITDEQSVTKKEPEVQVPGYGTMPLDMLKRHVQSLSKDFNDSIQKGEFLKAAYRTEQFYNALMALAKALPKSDDNKDLEEAIRPFKAAFNAKPKQKGPGYNKDDYEYTEFVPNLKSKDARQDWAIDRDVKKANQKLQSKSKPQQKDTGFYKNYLSNRPIREGEVVSMQARKTPLVIAGSPYDWDIYDLRTNKMVANILGGDRHESPLYEVRINRNGMTKETRMLPTYVVTSGPNNTPPYKAFELEAPADRDKIEKSPGPGGTTKLRPDNMDVIAHLAKMTGQGKYYGYQTVLVEEGLDPYELVEKALGAKIMEIDDAMELGYTDEDPEDSSSIVYVGTQKNEGYSAGAVGGAGLGEDTAYAGGMGQGGYAGQSYRKYKAKPAGTSESSIMKGIQNEYELDSTRKIEFSKENPPSLDHLYRQFIHTMLSSENTVQPKDWIDKVNKRYGTSYTWKDYQNKGHKDYTNNWDKIVKKYILGK